MSGKSKEEARRWFLQAHYDLEAARWNLKGGFYNTVCFLAQQGAEKALKSLMTHSLVEMILEGGKKHPGLEDLLDEARSLDIHYIPARYPNGLPSGYPHQFYGKRTAEEGLKSAERIYEAVYDYYEGKEEDQITTPPM
jgi:HEPN domain-containing protein